MTNDRVILQVIDTIRCGALPFFVVSMSMSQRTMAAIVSNVVQYY